MIYIIDLLVFRYFFGTNRLIPVGGIVKTQIQWPFFVKDFFMILCILVFIGSDFVCVGDFLLPTYLFSYPNFSVENN